jgi:hypothetical protein
MQPRTSRQHVLLRGEALEERDDLIKHDIKVHHRPSTCASAASAWGGQKVVAMVRYH